MKKSKDVMRRMSAILMSLLVVVNMVPSAVFALDGQPDETLGNVGSIVAVDPDAPAVDPDAPVVDPDAPAVDPNAPAEGLPAEGLVDVGGLPEGEQKVKALRAPLTRIAEDFTALAMFTPEPDATSTEWIDNEDGSAQSLAGHTFFMEMRFTKSEGADDVETKVFTLTGENLDSLNLASALKASTWSAACTRSSMIRPARSPRMRSLSRSAEKAPPTILCP